MGVKLRGAKITRFAPPTRDFSCAENDGFVNKSESPVNEIFGSFK